MLDENNLKRRALITCCIILVLAPLFVYFPVIFSDYTISHNEYSTQPTTFGSKDILNVVDPSAGSYQDEPWLFYIRKSLLNKSIPLINRYNGLGGTFIESIQPAPIYPLNLLLPLIPANSSNFFDIFQIIHLYILAFGLFFLFRLYAKNLIALLLAISVALSFSTFLNINMVHFRVYSWTPWLAYIGVIFARNDKISFRHIVSFAVLLFISISAGNPQESFFGIMTAVTIYLIESYREKNFSKTRLFFFFSTLVTGLILSLPVLLPYFVGIRRKTLFSVSAPSRILQALSYDWLSNLVFPNINGVNWDFINKFPTQDIVSSFSPIVIVGCILSIIYLVKDKDKKDNRFKLITLFIIIAGIIKISPLGSINILTKIPFLNGFRFTKYTFYLHIFTGILAAHSLNEFYISKKRHITNLKKASRLYIACFILALLFFYAFHKKWEFNFQSAPHIYSMLCWISTMVFTVLFAHFFSLRTKKSLYILVGISIIYAMTINPWGFKKEDPYLITNMISAADYSDANWEHGVSKGGVGFFVSHVRKLENLEVGDSLVFERSGKRLITQINNDQVWTNGELLDPEKDGYPHSIEIIKKTQVVKTSLDRALAHDIPNTNILELKEDISENDPVANKFYRDFMYNYISIDQLASAEFTDVNWENGIHRNQAGFFVTNDRKLRYLKLGDSLKFNHSGIRKVRSLIDNQVWVTGGLLDPVGDGYPNTIQIARKTNATALSNNRVVSHEIPNTNILESNENISEFDPITNTFYRNFMNKHFKVYNPIFHLQPVKSDTVSEEQSKILKLLGVSKYYDKKLKHTPFPLAYIIEEDDFVNTQKLFAEGKIISAIDYLELRKNDLIEINEDSNVNNFEFKVPNTFSFEDDKNYKLIFSNAFSTSYTYNKVKPNIFLDIFNVWDIKNNQTIRIKYFPDGLLYGLIAAGIAIAILAILFFIIKNYYTPGSKPLIHRFKRGYTAFLLIYILFIMATFAYRFSVDLKFHPTNGDFQTFNPLKRLSDGQVMGRDFVPYLGVGVTYALYPIYKLCGENLFASEMSAYFLSSCSLFFAIMSLIIFFNKEVHHKKKKEKLPSILNAMFYGALFSSFSLIDPLRIRGIRFFDLSRMLLLPGNSLRPIRGILPFIIAMSI
ncbi:hypothetical protein ACFL2A_02515, partial [Thermodesulfobacteriota bacterium]